MIPLLEAYMPIWQTITMGWIINSGANQHLTVSTVGMTNVVDISNLKITVGHPNGTLATVSHVGNLHVTKNVMLFDVLVIPGYCVSLLSVNEKITDSKLFVGFDEEKCYIQDLKREIISGTGSETGGLYLFDLQSNKNIGNVNLVHSFHVSKTLWHSKLGHPADQVLAVLKNDLNLSKNTDVSAYEICLRAKQTKEPFPLSDHKSKKLGDLVHLDLLPTSVLNGKSPYELVYDKKPNLSDLRSFGCLCFSTILNNIDKFTSRDVKFFEIVFLFKMRNTSVNDNGKLPQLRKGVLHSLKQILKPHSYLRMRLQPKLRKQAYLSKLKYKIEKHISYAKLNHVNYCFATTLNKSVEPTSYYEADTDPRWVEAMNNKIDALYRNHTWIIVDLPKGRKAIGNKWIYKIKYKASGEVVRYKARVVTKGFNQKDGFGYDETFSPIVKMVTVRCLIAVAVSNSWPLYQLDINNAFLYGHLVEDVYMTLPLSFGDDNGNKVCKLNKSLSRLKQAWNAKLNAALIKHGFVQSKFDYSLFIKESGSVFVALLVLWMIL
uniref:Ribonuclease H-like domain-containing protein n=1 Tax=Tanacetum cinerariifolium TaxID=118510 RepID=A0A6L2KKJ8_TANCI|nr:ribonuclease H-like domain-containing protein [Tanacetum cinerariifolium]